MSDNEEKIEIWGARVHNLKNIDVEIPRNAFTVITAVSRHWRSTRYMPRHNVATSRRSRLMPGISWETWNVPMLIR